MKLCKYMLTVIVVCFHTMALYGSIIITPLVNFLISITQLYCNVLVFYNVFHEVILYANIVLSKFVCVYDLVNR